MKSRIIVTRDTRREWRAYGDGDETTRPAVSEEIHHAAENIAANWVRFTRADQMVEEPVALRTWRIADRKGRGWIETAWMSRPRPIYALRGMYGFGIDATGALYDHARRRTMNFDDDVRIWMPMGDVEASRYSTAVLSGYLLPYLYNMANH